MSNSRILNFELNEPVTIALATTQTMDVFNDYNKPQVLFSLADNRRLYATPELGRQIKNIGVRELESFCIRKYKKGRNVFYDVWLAPATEKRRAEEEAPEIARQLMEETAIGAILIGLIVPTGKGKKWYLRGVFLAPVISLVWITALFLAAAVWRW